MHREHPLRILKYSTKTLWLLIFPILRGAMNIKNSLVFQEMKNIPEIFFNWLHGVWFDLLILACILGYGFLVWFFRKFTVKENQIYVQDGFIFTRIRILPIKNISSMTIERPFFLKAFHASYIYIDTASGLLDVADIQLLIKQQDEMIFYSALPRIRHGKRHNYQQKVKIWQILLFSVIFSSSFSGALYLAMFWFQGGRIARDLINEFQLTERLNLVSQEVAEHLAGIPPIAVAVGIVILSTWGLSFINNLLRYSGFYMESDKRQLFVKSGIVTTRFFHLQNHKINFLDIRQNFITKMFQIYSFTVNCSGYGTQKGTLPICLPILTRKQLETAMPFIFPASRMLKIQLRPPKSSWFGYTCIWIIYLLAIIPATELMKYLSPTVQEFLNIFESISVIIPAKEITEQLLPALQEILNSLQFMIALPIFWKLIIQVSALLTNGVTISKNQVFVKYCKGFTFHTIIAEKDCIVKIRIQQYIWQKWANKCHLTIYFRSEKSRNCKLYGLDYQQTRAYFSEFLTPVNK
ncbi:MAG: PH domain-containing protein [Oscillospiraceae bacterium]|nr:PH domain-containing protein [Oscillospiraceae bacterium]